MVCEVELRVANRVAKIPLKRSQHSALPTTLEKPHTKTKAGNHLGRGDLDLDLAGDRSKHPEAEGG